MGSCTLPEIFGLKKWFDDKFGDCCDWHDERYLKRDCWKIQADYMLSAMIAMKGPRYFILGILAFVVLTISPLSYKMWLT